MTLVYTVSVLSLIAGLLYGTRSGFRLEKMNRTLLLNTGLLVLSLFAMLMAAWHMGSFPETVATAFMMVTYSLFAGFFIGYGRRLYRLRKDSGYLLYVHRSFLTDYATGIAAVLLILHGIYRTSLLGDLPVTGIRLTSGLSIIAAGVMSWVVKPVPEFMSDGIFLIDTLIPWDRVVAWSWQSERVLNIDYLSKEKEEEADLLRLSTTIPEEDRFEIETLLKARLDEFRKERKKKLPGT